MVQTTPHLFGWLFYSGRLGDSDKTAIIEEHKEFKRSLAPYFEEMYLKAAQYRLIAQRSSQVIPVSDDRPARD